MKKIIRKIVFAGISIYLTSLWNKGFILPPNLNKLVITIIIVAVIIYLIVPLTKLILLPLNILTLGLVSVITYFLVFYFVMTKFSLVEIKSWTFPGFSLYGLTINKINVSMFINVILSTISISSIINLLESIL